MTLGKEGDETKEQWHLSEKDAVRVRILPLSFSPLLHQQSGTFIADRINRDVQPCR